MSQVSSDTATRKRPLRVGFIVADEREALSRHHLPEPYFGSAPSSLLAGLRQMPDLELHILSCVRQAVRAPERLSKNIHYHALRVPRWGFLQSGYVPCLQKIRRKVRELGVNVVHGQGTERYYALAAAHSGLPNVITIHGNMRQVARAIRARPFSFHWFTARLESWAVRRSGGVVCLSRYTQQQVQGLARRTWLIPNAVDEAFFSVIRREQTEPTLVCVANVTPYKNQNLLIRALDPIASEHPLRLVLLGAVNRQEPYGREFLKLVESRPWCVHRGFVAGEALRVQLGEARGLVLPSLEDNCPMAVLEAMAAALPVAASRIGGIPDLMEEGITGLLFDPRDAPSIRKAVVQLLFDPASGESMGAAGRRRALDRHHPVVIARQHVEMYQELLGE